MIQIGKAGLLQSLEFTYCVFKRDREQIWRKQTFQLGTAGLGQLAACRISKGWSAGAELCRGLSGTSLLQMFVLFPEESACGGRGSPAWSQPLYSITRRGPQQSELPLALGRQEDAAIKRGRALLGRKVFALGPGAPAGGIRWVGSTESGAGSSLTSVGSGEEGPGRTHGVFKAVVKDLCDCKEGSGRAWGPGCLQAVPGAWVAGYVVGADRELERKMD